MHSIINRIIFDLPSQCSAPDMAFFPIEVRLIKLFGRRWRLGGRIERQQPGLPCCRKRKQNGRTGLQGIQIVKVLLSRTMKIVSPQSKGSAGRQTSGSDVSSIREWDVGYGFFCPG